MVAAGPRPQPVLPMALHPLSMVTVAVLCAVGCASAPVEVVGEDGWSRRYALPFDRVWTAAVTVLSDGGYVLGEQDRGQGRIRAESSSEPAYRAVVLLVRIHQRVEFVSVSVQASGGASGSRTEIGRLDRAVSGFLDELDSRLLRR